MPDSKETLQSVMRGVSVLEQLCCSAEDVGVTEVARALKVNKTTVFRILSTLVAMGFAEQDPKTERYRPTMKILSLSNRVLNRLEVRSMAAPRLKELVKATNCPAHLAVLDAAEIVIIDKVEATTGMRFHIGRRSPLYCTGLGKVFLAHFSERELEQYLAATHFVQHTAHTITDPAKLRAEIEHIASVGYAFDRQEHNIGVSCVAAPIKDYAERVVASISVTGPSLQIETNVDLLKARIVECAADISRKMGYRLYGDDKKC